MKLEEGKIYQLNNNNWIHIKEITYFNEDNSKPYLVVCSNECNIKKESKTTIGRRIYEYHDLYKRLKP